MLFKLFPYSRLSKWMIPRRGYCEGSLPNAVTTWLEDMCEMLHPKTMHICDGSLEEREVIIQDLIDAKILVKCKQQNNCFVVRSDPHDTSRDPRRVFVAAYNRDEFLTSDPIATCAGSTLSNVENLLGNYMPMTQVDQEIESRFYKSMKGRKMYVVPFVLGPATGDTKIMGIQITDSGLTALLTILMARSGSEAQTEMMRRLDESSCFQKFTKLVHASGCEPHNPPNWSSNREKYIIINLPEKREIWSFGSNYWENSLLVKKGAALQLAMHLGRSDKYLAANMAVISVEHSSETKYIGIMGPTGSGKSVMASVSSKTRNCPLRVGLVSDDISWLKFNQETGRLHALNPETGIYPLIKGVSRCSTPNLNHVACGNCIMMNTGISGEDSAWWEGLDLPDKDSVNITDWRGKPWRPDGPRAAHLDARFCNTMINTSNLDARWENGHGVPLSAIIILTRRHEGHPLLMETSTWTQGIYHLASIRTRYHNQPLDCHKIHWEPMGSRHYIGYNLGKMIDNWMNLSTVKDIKLPKIFLVNLFLMDNWMKDHMWIGYDNNTSIIKWIMDRLDKKVQGLEFPLGLLPCEKEFQMPDRQIYTFDSMVNFNADYWQCELNNFEKILKEQLPEDVPTLLCREIVQMKARLTPSPCVPMPCPCA